MTRCSLEKERVHIAYTSGSQSVNEGSQGRNANRNQEVGTEARPWIKSASGLFHVLCSLTLKKKKKKKAEPTCLGMAQPITLISNQDNAPQAHWQASLIKAIPQLMFSLPPKTLGWVKLAMKTSMRVCKYAGVTGVLATRRPRRKEDPKVKVHLCYRLSLRPIKAT